jgi:class 3 adenylate cyclase/tetratricopeptide (TPR) repeat protein
MVTCTQCGHENPPDARFCNSCAAPLTAGPVSSREVRKTVTVVFCDVVGSTELGERYDPEVLRGLMARFYAAVREPVERHGGSVEKVIGDALVAVFGIPAVHEDDALRAVRAALEMRNAVRSMGDLQARIGVNTGDVLARDATQMESLVVGDAVNVAARLEQAAGAGEVLVGDETWQLVSHAVRGERVAPVPAKGKREPLIAWRLEEVDPAAGGHRRRLDLPIVGRQSELELLRWALERTQQGNRPHLVMVLGQPGIGKSRLVSDLPRLADGLAPLTGNCRPVTGSSSLEPLLEVARDALAADGASVADLMPGDTDAEAVAACLARGAEAGAPDIAWAVSRLVGAMAVERTVAIVLEDVHWADDILLDVVEQLLARNRHGSLLVVCTARPEFAERRPGWGAGANAATISLERLDDEQTRLLLAHADPNLAPEQAASIIDTAEGNPLFAEHLAALIGDNDHADRLPRSIQVLLSSRLEALPEPEREVVGVAAVAGRVFPVAAVEALVSRAIDAELEHLWQRELVEPATDGHQQFAHALLQDAAYGLIPKLRRGELHIQLARWLDANGADDAIVGNHLERAHALRAELGQMDAETVEVGEQAGARLAAAGRRADTMGDPRRARMLLLRALELLPESNPRRAVAMVDLAAASWNLITNEEEARLLAASIELASRLGLRAVELRARIMRMGAVPEDSPEALPELEWIAETDAELRELESLDDPRAVATALCTRAEAEFTLGRSGDAVASTRRAIEVLVPADEDIVWALGILVFALPESPMPVSEAEALLDRLMDDLGGRPTVRSELVQGKAMLALLAGDSARAWTLSDTAWEIERDLGRTRTSRERGNHVRMLMRGGRFEEARSALPPIIEQLDLRGSYSDAASFRSWLSLADARLGLHADAAKLASALLDGTVPGARYDARTRALRVLSEVHLAEGLVEDAVRTARESVAVAVTGDWAVLLAAAHLTLARALAASSDPAAAVEPANTAARLSEAKGYVGALASARELLDSLGAATS